MSSRLVAASAVTAAAPPEEPKAAPADPTSALLTARRADESLRAVIAGTNQLAFGMYQHLREVRRGQNLVFSPYGVATALAMAAAGARSDTESELVQLLDLPHDRQQAGATMERLRSEVQSAAQEGCRIQLANRLWGQSGLAFDGDFLTLLGDYHGAALGQIDFTDDPAAASRTINDWIGNQTGGEIPHLLSPSALDRTTRLVLTNALTFHGLWKSPFLDLFTKESPFYPVGEQSYGVQVSMMFNRGRFHYAQLDTFEILKLPYEGDRLSMIILLPSRADSLEAKLSEHLDAALQRLEGRQVDVELPRFKVSTEFSLDQALRRLSVTAPFSDHADFSGMVSDGTRLRLSTVVHQSVLGVDEKGTHAASATAAWLGGQSVPVKFLADRPFLFLIREEPHGLILFVGRLVNPRVS